MCVCVSLLVISASFVIRKSLLVFPQHFPLDFRRLMITNETQQQYAHVKPQLLQPTESGSGFEGF